MSRDTKDIAWLVRMSLELLTWLNRKTSSLTVLFSVDFRRGMTYSGRCAGIEDTTGKRFSPQWPSLASGSSPGSFLRFYRVPSELPVGGHVPGAWWYRSWSGGRRAGYRDPSASSSDSIGADSWHGIYSEGQGTLVFPLSSSTYCTWSQQCFSHSSTVCSLQAMRGCGSVSSACIHHCEGPRGWQTEHRLRNTQE